MDEDDEVIQEFLVEGREGLDQLDQELVALEDDPSNPDRLASIFRTIHSLKGTSGFLGYAKLESISHVGENLLSNMRDGVLELNQPITDALLNLVDASREILDNIDENGEEGDGNYDGLVATLAELANSSNQVGAVEALDAKAEHHVTHSGAPNAMADDAASQPLILNQPTPSGNALLPATPQENVEEPAVLSQGPLHAASPLSEAEDAEEEQEKEIPKIPKTLPPVGEADDEPQDEEAEEAKVSEAGDDDAEEAQASDSGPDDETEDNEDLDEENAASEAVSESSSDDASDDSPAEEAVASQQEVQAPAAAIPPPAPEVPSAPAAANDAQAEAPAAAAPVAPAPVAPAPSPAPVAKAPTPVAAPAPPEPAAIVETPKPAPVAKRATPKPSRAKDKSSAEVTIRVDVSLLDRLMNLVGELVLSRNQILQVSSRTEDSAFLATTQRLNHITTELQEGLMKTRMQPIKSVWAKFPRVVRDLAKMCEKDVRIEMEGEDTELDRTIIEAIKDPMTHIVRNSVDHGVESPEERKTRGKPAQGRLTLRAYHEGGKVNIEISDDGKGLDVKRIREKAIEKEVVSAGELARMTEREAMQLIFAPGFSTAAAVTQVSGRGVGMDVVKTNIERIGGTIDLSSRVNLGTTIKIKIPLTLAIIPALVVDCAGDSYAIPQVSLLELVRFEKEQVKSGVETVHGAPVCRLRGNLLPLVYLHEVLGVDPVPPEDEAVNIIVLQADDDTLVSSLTTSATPKRSKWSLSVRSSSRSASSRVQLSWGTDESLSFSMSLESRRQASLLRRKGIDDFDTSERQIARLRRNIRCSCSASTNTNEAPYLSRRSRVWKKFPRSASNSPAATKSCSTEARSCPSSASPMPWGAQPGLVPRSSRFWSTSDESEASA